MAKLFLFVFIAALSLNSPSRAGWVELKGQNLPKDAVSGGEDSTGQQYYVCRAGYNGGIYPGKLRLATGDCALSYAGAEYLARNFEVLVGPGYSWVREYNGNIPFDAFAAGKDQEGEILYICLGEVNAEWHPGKTRKSFRACHVPVDGKEVKTFHYRILVGN
jgi:hypothetical protein